MLIRPGGVGSFAARRGGAAPYDPGTLTLAGSPTIILSMAKAAGYSGPALRVRRDSDDTEQDIGWANNMPDKASATTFAGGAKLYLVTWYDQSGGGYNATQATKTLQPRFYTSDRWKNRMPTLNFDGWVTGPRAFQYLTITPPAGLNRNNVSVFMALAPTISYKLMYYFRGASAADATQIRMGTAAVSGVQVYNGSANNANPIPRSMPSVMGFSSGAAGVCRSYVRETVTTIVTPTSGAVDGAITIGTASDGLRGDVWAFVLFATAQTIIQSQAVVAELTARFSIPTTFGRRWIETGDSIVDGYQTENCLNQQWVMAGSGLIPVDTELFNFAVAGRSTATENSIKSLYAGLCGSGIPTAVITNIGTNDMKATNPTTAADSTYAVLANIPPAVQGAGGKFACRTLLPRSASGSGGNQTWWDRFNADIRANSALADLVIDRQANPTLGPNTAGVTGDTALYKDGLHPTESSNAILAAYEAAAINGLLV